MEAALPQRIDLAKLNAEASNDTKAIRQALALFVKTTGEAILKLEEAEKKHNVISWLQTTYKLKGAAQTITAKRLANICAELESINHLPHPQANAGLYHLQKELALLEGIINDSQAKQAKPQSPQKPAPSDTRRLNSHE